LGKRPGGGQRFVHGFEQRQIAEQKKDSQRSAAQKCCCSSPWISIDVGASIPESPGLHAQVASYKTMHCLSDEKASSKLKVPNIWLKGLKWRMTRILKRVCTREKPIVAVAFIYMNREERFLFIDINFFISHKSLGRIAQFTVLLLPRRCISRLRRCTRRRINEKGLRPEPR
jgi:hypothetical protein